MDDVFLGIGSNIGDKLNFLVEAVRKLRVLPFTEVVEFSSVYETEPVGFTKQASFLNAALWIRTSIDADEFHAGIKSIEREIGRQERIRWGPREIDIDILLFGSMIISDHALQIPHPEMVARKFVLQPLAEIAPEVVHPALRKTMRDLLAACGDISAVNKSAPKTKTFFELCKV